jgi:hypothetical protein
MVQSRGLAFAPLRSSDTISVAGPFDIGSSAQGLTSTAICVTLVHEYEFIKYFGAPLHLKTQWITALVEQEKAKCLLSLCLPSIPTIQIAGKAERKSALVHIIQTTS